jgi:hypothetical protein
MSAPSPVESEFASTEEAAAHYRWLRAKVAAAMTDEAPKIPHAEAMARLRDLIETRRRAAAGLGQ